MRRRAKQTMVTAALSLLFVGAVGVAQDAEAAGSTRRASPVDSNQFRSGTGGVAPQTASRQHFGWGELYVPTFYRAGTTYDLVIHFHGAPFLQEDNIEKTRINTVVASINLGIASNAYSDMYAASTSFDSLLGDVQKALDKTGRAPGAKLGRVALAAWSAGFAAVGAILSVPANADRVDAVLLADGLHTSFLAPGQLYTDGLTKYANYAQRAMRGEKLFCVTHSSIGTSGYASTTQAVGALLDMTAVEKDPLAVDGYNGMRSIYEAHKGSFHVKGYEGTNEKAHIDHVKGMHETVLPYLKLRWR